MKPHTLFLFTRTPLHVGAGSSVGAIDLPIQRERHSRHPIIPGTSIKGVLRYTASSLDSLSQEKVDDMFGPELVGEGVGKDVEARAGDITFSEARPLAFPVRSAKGSFAYITCPLILKRFIRETDLQGLPELPELADQSCLAGGKVALPSKKVVLEEYAFAHSGSFPEPWETALKALIKDPVWQECAGRLVLLSDGDFTHFVSTTTEISQHIKIDPQTGAVVNRLLFNLESVPAETLFFAPVHVVQRPRSRSKKGAEVYTTDCAAELAALIGRHPVLQFGGNSTTGRGFCSLTLA
jgi:CRISPR-associated protein Cmr4